MKKLMLNWILYLCAISLCLGLWDPSPSLSQKQPADSKTPPVKAKEQPKATSEKQPEMILETPEHNAGLVYEGAAVAHTFIVKNKGKAELLINQVKPG